MNTKLIIACVAATALALAAGMVGGMLVSRLPAPAPSSNMTQLARELNLNSDQERQMRDIWQSVQKTAQDCYRDARRLESQRDQKLEDLLNDEQKKQFAKITQDYNEGYGSLKAKRNAAFRGGIEQTRQLLNETQRQKYEQILKAKLGPTAAEEAGLQARRDTAGDSAL